jgi:hypothetical protein
MLFYYYRFVIPYSLTEAGSSFSEIPRSMNYFLKNQEISLPAGRKQLMAALKKGETNILSMIYDIVLHTARVESNGIKRLFMMYVEGRRQPKTVFKNEYGFDIGSIEQIVDEYGNGEIEIYGNKYYYKLPQQPGDTLSVFRHSEAQPLIIIATEILAAGIFSGALQSKLPLDYFFCILLSICWFLQLPQNKDYFKPPIVSTIPGPLQA